MTEPTLGNHRPMASRNAVGQSWCGRVERAASSHTVKNVGTTELREVQIQAQDTRSGEVATAGVGARGVYAN